MLDEIFVICQVGEESSAIRQRADEVCDFIVKPIAEGLDLRVARSDRDPTPGQVTAQIIRSLIAARVVLADLTGGNANVYYELAVAHSFGKPVIVLVDRADELTFDTSTERVIEIGAGDVLGVTQVEKAKKRLGDALSVVLAEDYRPRSLVSEAAGTQSLHDLAPDNPVATELALVRERVELLLARIPEQPEQPEQMQQDYWARDAAFLWSVLRNNRDISTADLSMLSKQTQSPPLQRSIKRELNRRKAEAEESSTGEDQFS
jgi:hypothetical protein